MSERGSSDWVCGRRGRSVPDERGGARWRSPLPGPLRGAPVLGGRFGRRSSPPRCVSWGISAFPCRAKDTVPFDDLRRCNSKWNAKCNCRKYRITPHAKVGGNSNGCSAVSYFSTRWGSIIGAGRLSFRVRDGSGRFPAAVAAVTLFYFQPRCYLVVGCGLFDSVVWFRGCERMLWCYTHFFYVPIGFLGTPCCWGVCKFSAG